MSVGEYALTEGMTVKDIPMSEIYPDDTFNVRGMIRPSDIVELAGNINRYGLLQPITIQPYALHPPEIYRVVLGHRRQAAFKYLRRETIPAIIKENLSDLEALALNFNENVNRKELNILEEAYGIGRFLAAGETVETTAKIVNKGKQWVTIRKNLLEMPKEIQEDAAAGWLTQAQILDLSSINDHDEQLSLVKQIKEAKQRGEERLPKIKQKKVDPTIKKVRNRMAGLDMIDHIVDETGVTSPFTRTIAWMIGEISDLDLEKGIPYSPPIEVRDLINIKKTW